MKLKIEPDVARKQLVLDQSKRYGITPAFDLDTLSTYFAFCDTRGPYSVIASRDNISTIDEIPDLRWHVSVALSTGVPRWSDFVAIVQEVRPGVMFCVPMPPRQFWINVNPNTLHVWETKDERLERMWREEGMAVRDGQRQGRFPGSPTPS